MKKTFVAISSLVLFAVLSIGAAAQDPVGATKKAGSKAADTTKQAAEKTADTTKKAAEKTADTTKQAAEKTKQAVAGKSDADVGKCITDALAADAKLKDQGLSATVTNGEATLTGNAKTSADKKAAAAHAKKCGAKKVTNNIALPPPAAKPEKKPEAAKKP